MLHGYDFHCAISFFITYLKAKQIQLQVLY